MRLSLPSKRSNPTSSLTTYHVHPRETAAQPPPSPSPSPPPELLLIIADYLPTSSLRSFAIASPQLYATLQITLQRRIITDKSLRFTLPQYPTSTALQWASFNGDYGLVEEMLATGMWEVDEIIDGCGQTALCLAAATGDEKTVKLLLRHGGAVDGTEARRKGLSWYWGSTPLHKAKNGIVLGWVAEEALSRSKKGRRKGMRKKG
ncbi:hypothetical protein BDD12DRAFT_904863 [Trichophaea hybrida]|nr:hypothetical protein BDD12DRAFT_904863 [Trichophaea hybrida]